jgi:hypothetical protein
MTRRCGPNVPSCEPSDLGRRRPAPGTFDQVTGHQGCAVTRLADVAHIRQLAASHGQTGWHAHAFPLSVDGIEIVASLILFADRRGGRRSGWLPWAALAIGTAGSLTANIAAAGPDPVSRVIAGWPGARAADRRQAAIRHVRPQPFIARQQPIAPPRSGPCRHRNVAVTRLGHVPST